MAEQNRGKSRRKRRNAARSGFADRGWMIEVRHPWLTERAQVTSGIGVLLGLWLAGSTSVFGAPEEALYWNGTLGGLLIAVVSGMSFFCARKIISSGISVGWELG